jgi:uncharacterized protein YndB with AHSA1/START domain
MVSISRMLDAPPEMVYRAFADPDQLFRSGGARKATGRRARPSTLTFAPAGI